MDRKLLIKKIIKEAIDQINSAPSGKKDLQYSVYKGKNDGKLYILFKGLEGVDRQTLLNLKATRSPTGIYYWANFENPEALFKNPSFIKAHKYLLDRGYEVPPIDLMEIEANNLKLSRYTAQELKEQESKTNNLWKTILSSIQSQKTQDLLKKIGRIGFDFNEKLLGHVLHPNNALRAYAVKPDATFVAQVNAWRGYNRLVRPNATKIILILSSQQKDFKKAEQELGVKRSDVSGNQHLKNAFNVAASVGPNAYHPMVYYDVSDTFVIPGYEDKFTGIAGYVDNLQGVFNDLAKEKYGEVEVDTKDLNVDINSERNKLFSINFITFLENDKSAHPELAKKFKSLDPILDSTVVSMAKSYYYNIAYDREHDEKIRNGKTYSSVIVTLISNSVAEVETVKILAKYEDYIKDVLYEEKDFTSIAAQVTKVNYGLQEASKKNGNMNESKDSIMNEAKKITAVDVMKMLNINPEQIINKGGNAVDTANESEESNCDAKEIIEIKENFYNTLNKLFKTK